MTRDKSSKLSPLLKWAGGKEQELKYIHPIMPTNFERFFEPFLGGGAVYFSINEDIPKFVNDLSVELMGVYRCVKEQDPIFLDTINEISLNWDLLSRLANDNSNEIQGVFFSLFHDEIDVQMFNDWILAFIRKNTNLFDEMLPETLNMNKNNLLKELEKTIRNKFFRMKKISIEKGLLPASDVVENFESALKASFYTHLRHLYNFKDEYGFNLSIRVALFFFIRNYAYSGMFRYNKAGHFNVPYGGIGYNSKSLSKKLRYFRTPLLNRHLSTTSLHSSDFETFLNSYTLSERDFIFLDPPYDTEFSTYDKNEFGKDEQRRLAQFLTKGCKAKWLMIIKYTDFIFDLYKNCEGVDIMSFDKNYLVSFMNRNDKKVRHLIIKNY